MEYAVIGGGFTGLAAAYEFSKNGHDVTVFERDAKLGGLAASFKVGEQELERFYHHWLGTDSHVFDLVKEIGHGDKLLLKESKVGIYYANKSFRFSSPIDLLLFKPLPFWSRIRFGLSILYSWTIRDMGPLEDVSAEDWLIKVAGRKAYETIWQPLLIGKFGEENYRDVAAVWLWNKLIQRGQSRDSSAKERLGYYRGGFSEFVNDLADKITEAGGKIETGVEVTRIVSTEDGRIGIEVDEKRRQNYQGVLYTGHTPEFATLIQHSGFAEYARELRGISYLANICLILETSKSLSEIYWLNVNDASFPFVGIIEHTNFEAKENYAGNHLIYLSKYLPSTHELYQMDSEALLAYAVPHIKRLFPEFDEQTIVRHYTWKADYAQPLIIKNYPSKIPELRTPIAGLFLCTMAQVYPQDRGTNYAVQYGRLAAQEMMGS